VCFSHSRTQPPSLISAMAMPVSFSLFLARRDPITVCGGRHPFPCAMPSPRFEICVRSIGGRASHHTSTIMITCTSLIVRRGQHCLQWHELFRPAFESLPSAVHLFLFYSSSLIKLQSLHQPHNSCCHLCSTPQSHPPGASGSWDAGVAPAIHTRY
jgi:hypothetical protein